MSTTEAIIAEWAINCHHETNHRYDTHPYSIHLRMVRDVAEEFINILPPDRREVALCACWCHDLIEDARLTYNDVKQQAGEEVAEITYALTNEKGRTRKDRANYKYYEGIRNNLVAHFVKVCDRLANVEYSSRSKSGMADMYRKEMESFEAELGCPGFRPMFEKMKSLLKNN